MTVEKTMQVPCVLRQEDYEWMLAEWRSCCDRVGAANAPTFAQFVGIFVRMVRESAQVAKQASEVSA